MPNPAIIPPHNSTSPPTILALQHTHPPSKSAIHSLKHIRRPGKKYWEELTPYPIRRLHHHLGLQQQLVAERLLVLGAQLDLVGLRLHQDGQQLLGGGVGDGGDGFEAVVP